MKVVLMTSESDTFWDLSKNVRKGRPPRLNQTNSGSLGIHCHSLERQLPECLEMDQFQAWTGPIKDVLAGPVIEVTNFGNLIEKRGIVVEPWYLSSDLGWVRDSEAYHPLWSTDALWQEVAPNDDLLESVESADAIVAAFPSSIVLNNGGLRKLLSSSPAAAVATGGSAHATLTLKPGCLALRTRGVARIGADNRQRILEWLGA